MNVKANLEFKKRWLQWVVDFIQTDLNSVPKPNLRGKTAELYYFSSSLFVEENFEKFLSSCNFDKLPEIQIDNFDFNALIRQREQDNNKFYRLKQATVRRGTIRIGGSNEEAEEALSKFAPELQDIQNVLRDFIEKTQKIKILWEPFLLADSKNYLDIRRFPGALYWEFRSVLKNFSPGDSAILNLARLMDGLNTDAIRNCKGCGRYFLNTSEREKLYCNSLCASRSITQMKYEERKKHPREYKAYLRKQNEYSKARYRKLMMQMRPNIQIGKLAKKRNHKKISRKED